MLLTPMNKCGECWQEMQYKRSDRIIQTIAKTVMQLFLVVASALSLIPALVGSLMITNRNVQPQESFEKWDIPFDNVIKKRCEELGVHDLKTSDGSIYAKIIEGLGILSPSVYSVNVRKVNPDLVYVEFKMKGQGVKKASNSVYGNIVNCFRPEKTNPLTTKQIGNIADGLLGLTAKREGLTGLLVDGAVCLLTGASLVTLGEYREDQLLELIHPCTRILLEIHPFSEKLTLKICY